MRYLILLLTLTMSFGQGDVSQKIIELTIEGGSYTDLNTIFPDYDLDWAMINIIQCPTSECWITPNNTESYRHRLLQSQSSYIFASQSTLYTDGNDSDNLRFVFGQTGTYTIKLLVTAEFPQDETPYTQADLDNAYYEGAQSGDVSGDGVLNVMDLVQYINMILDF